MPVLRPRWESAPPSASADTDDIMIGDGALGPGHATIEVKGGAINQVVGDSPLTLKDEARSRALSRSSRST